MKKQISLVGLKEGSTVAVAVSGGKDSMCLLHALLSVKNDKNLIVKAVNIDHGIRGIDSEKDSLFVKNYCKSLGVELKFFKVDAVGFSKENGYTLEEGARILRYDIFKNLIKEGYADYVCTAHHLTDNYETVLFNLLRGTGISGLKGIRNLKSGIIRPLSDVSRREIDNYIIENNIPHVEDLSNDDLSYTRNFIRKKVCPIIDEKFPNAEKAIKRLSDIATSEDEFLQNLADSYIEKIGDKYYFDKNLHPVLVKRLAITIFKNLGITKDYENIHLEDVCKLASLQSGSKIVLPKGVVAVNEYDKISVFKEEVYDKFINYDYNLGEFNFHSTSVSVSNENTDRSLKFDGDKIPNGAVIRLRREGDVFKKFGGGTKKLKDYLIDKKIPKNERDLIPLIAKDNEVLLIFGVEISDKIKLDKNSKNCLYAKVIN